GQRRGLRNRRHCSVSGRGRSVRGDGSCSDRGRSASGRGRSGWIGDQRAAPAVAREFEVRRAHEGDGGSCPCNGKETVRIVDQGRIDIREDNLIRALKLSNLRVKIGRIL